MEEWNNNPMSMTNSEIDEKYNIPKTRTRGFSINTKEIVQNELSHLSFKKHVRLQGVLILMLLLIISAGHFVVFHVFANTQASSDYQQINTEFVWVFLAFSIIYFLRTIHILGTWKGTAKDLIKEKYDVNTNENVENEQATNVLSTIKSKYTAGTNFYNDNFGINGKYYLYLLYAGEFTESWVQLNNLFQTYLCTMEVGWNFVFISILMIDSFHRCKFMYKKIRGESSTIHFNERNLQVVLDIAMDIFFLVVPLVIMRFFNRMTLGRGEVFVIVLVPSISLFTKLPDVLEQFIYNQIVEEITVSQAKGSFFAKRRRRSLFGQSVNEHVVEIQNDAFPYVAKVVVLAISFMYALFLTVFILVQIANLSFQDTCEASFGNTNIWEKGCKIKTPFCKRPFSPKCNCAYLNIENDYTITSLPDNIVTEMDALRMVEIRMCNLTKLPSNMEKLVEMDSFEIAFTHLEEFQVDISKWNKLSRLTLWYNKISSYHEQSFWNHPTVKGIDIRDNPGMNFPNDENLVQLSLPSLSFLHMGNNSMSIKRSITRSSFPNLLFLYLNGNHIHKFPDESLQLKLRYLGIARCNLKAIPSYLSNFKSLSYLDARDNNITAVDKSLEKLIETNKIEAYFSGNDILCSSTSTRKEIIDCKPLCSKYCWSRNAGNDGFCDIECNSKDCEYDGGNCITT
eukprot:g8958.t1